ncbi:MAG: FkbM family methyltransferase [Candidatus Micrarchaeales archaeon]
MNNLTLSDRLLSRMSFMGKWIIKGKNYSFVTYPLIKNWYVPIVYRAGIVKKQEFTFRDQRNTSLIFRLNMKLMDKMSNGLTYRKRRFDKNHIYFSYKGKKLSFFYDTKNQFLDTIEQVKDQFITEEYRKLDVKGREVVDVGASIGDSAIYFAMKGAHRVYGFEAYPYSYRIALKNVKLNNLNKKVMLFNECLGGKPGSILIDEKFKSEERSPLMHFEKGKRIRVITLDEIVKRHNIKDAILKIDCEGCEYDIVLKTKPEILRRFSQIMIEYHYGFRDLEKKLREAGFRIWHDLPTYQKNPAKELKGLKPMHWGFILASRDERQHYSRTSDA